MMTFDEWCKANLPKNLGVSYLSNAKFVGDQDGDAKIDHKSWCECRFGIKKIIFNYPATIVFWNDGMKTVVKCSEGDKFNKFQGVAAAVMRRMYENLYGSMNYIKKKIAEAQDDSPKLENDVKKMVEKTEKKEKNEEESCKIKIIKFFEMEKACQTLELMKLSIKKTGYISICEYYKIAEHEELITQDINQCQYGWINLGKAFISEDFETMWYQIKLPEPINIVKAKVKKAEKES